MPRFRDRQRPPEGSATSALAPSLDQVRRLAADALRPAQFYLGNGLTVELEHQVREEVSWEIYRGRLLDPAHTARRHVFEAWNLFLINENGRSAEPLLSLKLDAASGQLHVTRAIYCYAWEGYDQGDNVILSREVRKWVRELVGTVQLDQFGDVEELRDEIICRLFLAVVGTSRLPLTSVESPLPGFSLGELAYFNRAEAESTAAPGPMRSYRELIEKALTDELAWVEKAKLLETVLHATPWEELAKAADLFMARWHRLQRDPEAVVRIRGLLAVLQAVDERWHVRQDLVALFRTLFNEASLSPYTDLVDKTLAFLEVLENKGHLTAAAVADFLGCLLRQLGRHLTAYDLITFHHRGANYPDALLLDAALKAILERAGRHPALFSDFSGDSQHERRRKRLLRRALRQGWMLRHRYEGHLVPDAPTSQGENVRVLPPPHVRVPEEQITYPHRRTKRLFDGDPLDRYLGDKARAVLRQSINDLRHPAELGELGMAVFLDRPLNGGKAPLEPDQTPLLSFLAFSRSIALQRLKYLAEELGLTTDRSEYEGLRNRLETELEVWGLPVEAVDSTALPGSVSLADARKAADDFVFLRNTDQSIADFDRLYFFGDLLGRFCLDDLNWSAPVLIVRASCATNSAEKRLAIYDFRLRKRLELAYDPRPGYVSRGGVEYPVSPLRVLRVWEKAEGDGPLRDRDLSAEEVVLLHPRV
jgi:hypothetical protein